MTLSSPGKDAAVAASALPALVRVLKSGAPPNITLSALHVIKGLMTDSRYGADVLAAGVLPALVLLRLQSSGDPEIQQFAACVHSWACRYESEENHHAAVTVAGPAAGAQPGPVAPRVCANPGCGAKRGLRRCGGCHTVRYCSEACSRTHWREHKAECRRVQAEQAQAAAASE